MASVQGGGVTSGSHTKNSSSGTYQLNAGNLTLRMDDGSLKKRTFFLGKADAVMAAIDGRIYFLKE